MDTSPTGQFTYYLDISPTRLVFAEYNIGYGVARLGEKAPVVLFLAAIGALNKFGFDTWLRFGLLFTALATTLGNLWWLFAENIFLLNVAKSQSI